MTQHDSSLLNFSLAFYASDKRSKEWNREHFATKVEQRAYFECLCGGTEEGRERAGIYENTCIQKLFLTFPHSQEMLATEFSALSVGLSSTQSVSSMTSRTPTGEQGTTRLNTY